LKYHVEIKISKLICGLAVRQTERKKEGGRGDKSREIVEIRGADGAPPYLLSTVATQLIS